MVKIQTKNKFLTLPKSYFEYPEVWKLPKSSEKVLVLLDLTAAAIKQGDTDPDDLHRLFYTAFTRAKQELHIVDPRDFNKAYII